MATIQWTVGDVSKDNGVSKGVLYLPGQPGIPWNGLTSVEDKSNPSDPRLIFLDGVNVGLVQDTKDFSVTVSAFTYPEQFLGYTGFAGVLDKQFRKEFGLSYLVGDSLTGKIHLVYNASARPSDKNWKTKTNDTETSLFKWDISTRPKTLFGIRPTSHFVIDLAITPQDTIDDLTKELYGSSTTNPILPELSRIFEIYEQNARFQVIDNGNGTWTVNASAGGITVVDANTVNLDWPTVVALTSDVYNISTGF